MNIVVGEAALEGCLAAPRDPRGLVVFLQGSGRSPLSPRNRRLSAGLQRAGFATAVVDLITRHEDRVDRITHELRLDVELLSQRAIGVTNRVRTELGRLDLPLGYFGAGTGAPVSLVAAARRGDEVRAVVTRGGRPDLAGDALEGVGAPTLFIVGALDAPSIESSERASSRMSCARRIEIVPGATSLFEEPGAIDRVAQFAASWYARYLGPRAPRRTREGLSA